MSKTILALDPSTTIAGWALGTDGGQLIECGLVRGEVGLSPMDRAMGMAQEIAHKVAQHHKAVHHFIMEEPCVWQSPRGAAASNSGALTALSLGAGCMYNSLIYSVLPFERSTVTPQKWKGQLPKELFFDRMNKKYQLGLKYNLVNCNITDAVGLYEWFIGRKQK